MLSAMRSWPLTRECVLENCILGVETCPPHVITLATRKNCLIATFSADASCHSAGNLGGHEANSGRLESTPVGCPTETQHNDLSPFPLAQPSRASAEGTRGAGGFLLAVCRAKLEPNRDTRVSERHPTSAVTPRGQRSRRVICTCCVNSLSCACDVDGAARILQR